MSLFSVVRKSVLSFRPRIVVPERRIVTLAAGWEPDPELSSFWDFKDLKSQLPKEYAEMGNAYFIPENTPISDQGNIPSCVSNSCIDGFEILQGLEGNVTQWARMFLHNNVRLAMDTLHLNGGAHIWKALDVMRKTGCIPEELYPHDAALIHKRPPRHLYMTAARNKIMGYYRITSSGDAYIKDVLKAISNNHPVVFGTVVGAAWKAYRGDHDNAFMFPSDNGGRHAMLWTGWRIKDNRVHLWDRNSWSPFWGKNGHAWMDQSYATNPGTRDTWVLTKFGRAT